MASVFEERPRTSIWKVLGWGLVVGLVLTVGGYLGVQVNGWWTQRQLNQANMNAAFLIIQYNVQQGKLAIPPDMLPKPPAPAPAPAPAPVAPTPPADPVKK